jgi:hypothetical protein
MKFKCQHCGKETKIELPKEMIGDSNNEELLKLREKVKEYDIRFERQNAELKRTGKGIKSALSKTETPSMELQGEVQEEILIEDLQKAFPNDILEPIKKGQSGGDIVHKIFSKNGYEAGAILFESKNTKNWSNGWVDKLREDMKKVDASIGLLVSKAFPAKETDFIVQLDQKIWLCKPGLEVTSIVRILRDIILASHRTMVIEEFSSPEMHEEVFNFITNNFTDHLNDIKRTQEKLKKELDAERKAFITKWKARETLIDKMGDSALNMAGTLIGMGVPSVKLEQLTQLTLEE